MDRATALSWVSMAAMALIATPAGASRTLPTDLDGLVATSAMIVEGQVEAVDIAAGRTEPRTRVTLRVDRLFAGVSPGSRIEFDLPMGLMPDGTVLDIVEAPRFAAGERYLVFYKRGQWNITPVAGFGRGLYRMVQLGSETVFASVNGHCVAGVAAEGFALGPRVARPVGPPEFGEAAGIAPVATAGHATCLPADEVRARLAGYLGAHAIEGAPEWHRGPARSILRTRLMPEMKHVEPAAGVVPVCSGDGPGCAPGVQP